MQKHFSDSYSSTRSGSNAHTLEWTPVISSIEAAEVRGHVDNAAAQGGGSSSSNGSTHASDVCDQ